MKKRIIIRVVSDFKSLPVFSVLHRIRSLDFSCFLLFGLVLSISSVYSLTAKITTQTAAFMQEIENERMRNGTSEENDRSFPGWKLWDTPGKGQADNVVRV